MLKGSCLCKAVRFEIKGGFEHAPEAMGLFDSATGLRLAKHTFVGDKGDYYDINDGVPQSEAY